MSKINKFREECSDYRRVRCYNPKVHVSGWHDIQNDEDYVEKYNKMRDFYSAEYPTHKMEEKYKNVKRQCFVQLSNSQTRSLETLNHRNIPHPNVGSGGGGGAFIQEVSSQETPPSKSSTMFSGHTKMAFINGGFMLL
ncbi:conserved Plasmodium protein, unknown function [Plasmodium ovale curtisi]|uniref:Uncharacterized protein n=1 Tax=Plasmodium ovale curtisi TaxID=864141 RepID=A0A1A8VQE2_PLAOA|nr:conserved Plasmodium protein, unknown function [Plasmodium ovale curtisi]